MAHAVPHITVPHCTISGRVTLGETNKPEIGANIQDQLTRTLPTYAMTM